MIPATARYAFWVRANYFKADLAYKLDDADWTPIDTSAANVRDKLMVSEKPDHRFLGWIKVGVRKLAKGEHTLAIRLDGAIRHSSAIDCFTFAPPDFIPSGARKPADQPPAGPSTWFSMVADVDPLDEASVTDMSVLVPAPAGARGFLQRDGAALRFDKADEPVKFWGVNAGPDKDLTRAQLVQKIRFLRKHGVNMVRQHPVFAVLGPLGADGFDPERLERWDWWCAQLKEHGIYMTWSVFYPLRVAEDCGYPKELLQELDKGRDGLYSTSGLVNISRGLQDLERDYLEALLTHVNPYTKLAYKDDPALAVMEVHNEDCIFFHNPLNPLAAGEQWPRHSQRFRQQFRDWAKARYETDAALQKAWGTNDSFDSRAFRIYGAWQMGPDRKNVRSPKRLGDFIRFCTELQRSYYERRIKELRAMGTKAVTVTTAWHAGGAIANPANLYCDTAADMIDRHNYFGGGAGRHRITTGEVHNSTHLDQPGKGLPSIGFFQVEDRPFCSTEWTQKPPNQWKAESAPLIAFYGLGLQGWDASYHFACGSHRMGDGWPRLGCYVTETPHYIGQFPALAFAVAKGHVQEAPVAAARRVAVEDLFTGEDPLAQSFSARGGAGADRKEVAERDTPNEALAIGRVTLGFTDEPGTRIDWSRYWDRKARAIRSATDQLVWDYGRRIFVLRGPKTHAVVGFAGGHTFDLPGVHVRVQTRFVSLLFTPLDDQPLAESGHVLITALARDRQTGTVYNEDGTHLEQIGGPPLLLEPVEARIMLKGPPPRTVRALDVYGVPTDRTVELDGKAFAIDGRYRTYLYEITR